MAGTGALAVSPGRRAKPAEGSYSRHQAEDTVLYRLLAEHWRSFLAESEAEAEAGSGCGLPPFVVDEVEAFLGCGILARGFVRVACNDCRESRVVPFSCKRRGLCPSCLGRRMCDFARTSATTSCLASPCGSGCSPLRIVSAVTEPEAIDRILCHLGELPPPLARFAFCQRSGSLFSPRRAPETSIDGREDHRTTPLVPPIPLHSSVTRDGELGLNVTVSPGIGVQAEALGATTTELWAERAMKPRRGSLLSAEWGQTTAPR